MNPHGTIRHKGGHFLAWFAPLFITILLVFIASGSSENLVEAADSINSGVIMRVSTDSDGGQGNGWSGNYSSISADGRYVAFMSQASNLIPNDTNGAVDDVFIKDTHTGATVLVSTGPNGQGNGVSYGSSISADGRYVTFTSSASNLITNDTNNASDVFVKDMQTGVISCVSCNTNGQANGASYEGSISGDGRYVAFMSEASNLVPDDTNYVRDIFVKDTLSSMVTRVSTASGGGQGNGESVGFLPSISYDGRYIAFTSKASNLISNDTNGAVDDVFIKDTHTGATVLVSTGPSGQGSEGGGGPSISADGRYIAFSSGATNYVADYIDQPWPDVFVKDMLTGSIELVSSTYTTGKQGSNQSWHPSISADGRYIAFSSVASDLVPGDTNNCFNMQGPPGCPDIFVKDTQSGTMTRVSISSEGAQVNSWTDDASISADGRFVVFRSGASDLVNDDTNGQQDIFLTQVGTGVESPSPAISYYFSWYDSVWGKTWALMANSQANPDSTSYLLDLGTVDAFNNPVIEPLTTDYLHTASGWPTVHNIYMGKMGGPLRVNASNNLPLVSERSLFGNSFEEVWAVPYDELDSHYWWPVYDSSTPGMKNWILAANPWENQENIIAKIRIHRPPSEGGDIIESKNLAPGETWTPIYQGVFGGPVEMTAWAASGTESNPPDARKVVASQRVLWNGAFNEMTGIPASNLYSEYLWTWYDDDSPGADNWIVVGNPNPQDVYIVAVVGNPLSPIFVDVGMVLAGEVGVTRKPGMGGPVYVASCYDINDCTNTRANVFASQRVLFGPSFGELAGTRFTDIIPAYDWTWYDQQSPGSKNWVLVSNLSEQKLYAEITVEGVLKWSGGIEVLSNATPTLNGVMGGPVAARAWLWDTDLFGQQTKQTPMSILASQRVLWNGYFNEIVGK